MRALEAINDGSATDEHRRILKAAGGTSFRHGRFELALSMEEVGRKLKLAPGIVENRVDSGMAVNKAGFDGHTTKDEDERPRRESPFRLHGALAIGRKHKIKPHKQTV